jgi:hypothetical protein
MPVPCLTESDAESTIDDVQVCELTTSVGLDLESSEIFSPEMVDFLLNHLRD